MANSTALLLLVVVVALSIAGGVWGDVFLHNPSGSNGRLNEANTNRNNGNRLFDSQNNAKGKQQRGGILSPISYSFHLIYDEFFRVICLFVHIRLDVGWMMDGRPLSAALSV